MRLATRFGVKSLKSKVLVLSLLVALVPVISVTVYSSNVMHTLAITSGEKSGAALDKMAKNSLELIAESRADLIMSVLGILPTHVKSIGESAVLKMYLNEPEKHNELKSAVEERFASFFQSATVEFDKKKIALFTQIVYVDSGGIETVKVDRSGTVRSGGKVEDSLLKAAMNVKSSGRDVYLSEIVVSKETGNSILYAVTPLFQGSQFRGMVMASFDWAIVWDYILKDVKIGDTGYLYLTNEQGVLVSHPKYNLKDNVNIGDVQKYGKLAEIVNSKMLKGEKGFDRYLFEGVDKVVAYAPVLVENRFLALGATLPVAELRGDAIALEKDMDKANSDATRNLFIIVGATAVAVAAVSILFAKKVDIGPKVAKVLETVRGAAKGDLTVKSELKSSDEVGMLAAGVEDMISKMSSMINTIRGVSTQIDASTQQFAEGSRQVAATANQLASATQQIAKGASDQANAAQNTTNLMEQMNTKTKDIAQAAAESASQAKEGTKSSDEGLDAAKEAQLKMNEISDSSSHSANVVKGLVTRSKEIGQTANVIAGIADQTNLLALNAAIEAARAGEHGRGFAVVAEEVRKLAEESRRAADQISKLNDGIQSETENAVKAIEENATKSGSGVEAINKVFAALKKIQDTAKQSEFAVTNIRDSSTKQSEFAEQVTTAMSSIASASQEASATTEELSSSIEEINASVEENTSGAQELANIVRKLNDLVGRFKIRLEEAEKEVAPDLAPAEAKPEKIAHHEIAPKPEATVQK